MQSFPVMQEIKRFRSGAGLALLLLFPAFPKPALACSGCLAAGANAWAYVVSYLFLSLLPMVMLALLAAWIYRQHAISRTPRS